MKARRIGLCLILLAGAVAFAQNSDKKAEYWSAQDVQKQLADLASKAQSAGSGNFTLGDYTSHQIRLSVRTSSGGAEAHEHYDDIFVVTQGKATLTTGGTVENAKTKDGETQGSAIANGTTQEISAGDVVHIPAGTPHQLKIATGTLFSTIVVKVRE